MATVRISPVAGILSWEYIYAQAMRSYGDILSPAPGVVGFVLVYKEVSGGLVIG